MDVEESKYRRVSRIALFCQGIIWGVSTGIIPAMANAFKRSECDDACCAYFISLLVAAYYAGKIIGFPLGLYCAGKIRSTSKLISLYVLAVYCSILLFGVCYNSILLIVTKFIHGLLCGFGDHFLVRSQLQMSTYSVFWLGFGTASIVSGVFYISRDQPNYIIGHTATLFSSLPALIGSLITSNILLLAAFVIRSLYSSRESARYTRLLREEGTRGTAYDNILLSDSKPAADPMLSDEENEDYRGLDLQVPGRYIRGCSDYHEALRRWRSTLKWRRENGVDGILTERQDDYVTIKDAYPHYFHGRSRQGAPVYYEMPGKIDFKKLDQHGIKVDRLLRYYVFMSEYLWAHIEPSDDGQVISVIDIQGIKMSDLMGDSLLFVKNASQTAQNYYIERCQRVFVINAPFFFNMMWRVISPLLSEKTRSKVTIHGSNGKQELLKFIDDDQIPTPYGGTGGALGTSADELSLKTYVLTLNGGTGRHGALNTPKKIKGVRPLKRLESNRKNRRVDLSPPVVETTSPSAPKDDSASKESSGGRLFGMWQAVGSIKSKVAGFFASGSKEAYLGEENSYFFNSASQTWMLRRGNADIENLYTDERERTLAEEIVKGNVSKGYETPRVPRRVDRGRLSVLMAPTNKSAIRHSLDESIDSSTTTEFSEEDSELCSPDPIIDGGGDVTPDPGNLSQIATNLFEPGNGTLVMVFVFVFLKVIVIGAVELFPLYLYFSKSIVGLFMDPDEVGIVYLFSAGFTIVYQIVCSKIIDMRGQLFAQHIALQTSVCMIISLLFMIFLVRLNLVLSHIYIRITICILCATIWFASYSWIHYVSQFVAKLKSEYRNGISILFLFAEVLGGTLNTILISYSFNSKTPQDISTGYNTFLPFYAFLCALLPLAFLSWDMIRGRVGIVRRNRSNFSSS